MSVALHAAKESGRIQIVVLGDASDGDFVDLIPPEDDDNEIMV